MMMPYYINLMSNLMDTQLGENMLLFQRDNLIGDKILWGCKYLQMDKIVLKLKRNGRMEILILLSHILTTRESHTASLVKVRPVF